MSSHRDHVPGTESGCWHCTKLAYEPSWYASLLTFAGRERVPEGDAQTITT